MSKKNIIFVIEKGMKPWTKYNLKTNNMRQVIKGKTYDTTTAQVVGWYKNSSTLYKRVKAKDYFMGFDTDSCLRPLSENEAWKVMHSGEFIYDE